MESRLGTSGDRSIRPLNHGFTLCWFVDATSVRCPGISDRTWLVTSSSVIECDPVFRDSVANVRALLTIAIETPAAASLVQFRRTGRAGWSNAFGCASAVRMRALRTSGAE